MLKTISLLAVLTFLLVGCSGESPQDAKNGKHLRASFDAAKIAADISLEYGIISGEKLKRMITHQRIALREAQLVEDAFLDKLDMTFEFRNYYQKGLELELHGLDTKNIAENQYGQDLQFIWMEWVKSQRK